MNPIVLRMIRPLLLGTALALALPAAAAPFVYRGSLTDRGAPASGNYGFRISYYDAQFGGKQLAPATTLDGVQVSDGAFSTGLDLEPALQARDTLWLQVEVRDADGSFVPLAEREAVQPKTLAAGVCWDTLGNTDTLAGLNFLGTSNNVPLDIRANNLRAMRVIGNDPASFYGEAPSVILGARINSTGSAFGATIGGGGSTRIGPNDCPECANLALGDFSVVDGGRNNEARGDSSVVGGGFRNLASQYGAVVAGGQDNDAAGYAATVSGGDSNGASGYGTVPGGQLNCAGGNWSFAGGFKAKVRQSTSVPACTGAPQVDPSGDEGTFIWADSTNVDFVSTGPNQFLVRASGGVGLNTNNPTGAAAVSLHVKGFTSTPGTVVFESTKTNATNLSHIHFGTSADWYIRSAVSTGKVVIQDTGGQVGIGTAAVIAGHLIDTSAGGAFLSIGGTWTNGSSRTFKEAFASVDVGAILDKVLALPLTTWRYKGSPEGEHLGPMAEDFSAAFGLGGDEQHIATVDADGVALAAIQGLTKSSNARMPHCANDSTAWSRPWSAFISFQSWRATAARIRRTRSTARSTRARASATGSAAHRRSRRRRRAGRTASAAARAG